MRLASFFLVITALLSAAKQVSAQPAANVRGNLSGQTVTAISIYPHNTSIIYAGTLTGVFKSIDGGLSWGARSGPDWITAVGVDPEDPNTVYAVAYNDTDDGVFRSVDGGLTWTKLFSAVGAWSIAIDPRDANAIYVGAGYGDIGTTPGIFVTSDRGLSWVSKSDTSVYTVALDPQNPDIVYAGGRAILTSADRGQSWKDLVRYGPYPGSTYIIALAVDPSNSNVLYAGAYRDGLFKSTDRGATWNNIVLDREPTTVSRIAIDPHNPSTLYAAPEAIGGNGLFKTTDGGATWTSIPRLNGIRVWSLAIDPLQANTIYVGTGSGILKSFDGGGSWSENANSPILTLWAPAYCTRSGWDLSVGNAKPNTAVDLLGVSKGQPWAVSNWRTTDSNGALNESGNFAPDAIGTHSIQVEVNGSRSDPVSFVVSDCSPSKSGLGDQHEGSIIRVAPLAP